MNNILRKHYIATFLSLGFFLISIGAFVLVGVVTKKKEARVIAAREQVASYQENKKIFSEESKELKGILDRTALLEKNRITPATTPELLSSIESLANASKIDFAITSVQTPKPAGGEEQLIIDIAAKGSSMGLDHFLESLAHQVYEVQIKTISLHTTASSSTAPAIWELSASIRIVSY